MVSFNVWLVASRFGILKRSSLNTGVYEAFIIKSLGLSSCKFFFKKTKQRNKSFLMGFHRKGKKKEFCIYLM